MRCSLHFSTPLSEQQRFERKFCDLSGLGVPANENILAKYLKCCLPVFQDGFVAFQRYICVSYCRLN